MKIISWNVNSIRVRLENFMQVAQKINPDVFLLQETRVIDEQFPLEYFENLGYNIEIFGQKSRNGVAIFSKHAIEDVSKDFCEEARYIEAFTGGVFVASVYVPNGQEVDSDQYLYKLDFLKNLKQRFLKYKDEVFIAGGDYNVAPYNRDAYKENYDGLLCTELERKSMQAIREVGFFDVLDNDGYTWWNYRAGCFKKDKGFRIDQFYLSQKAKDIFNTGSVLRFARDLERPSDHAPILCELNTI